MSEIIKLKVPAEPESEFVSQGNLRFELVPNSTIETKSRAAADWMVSRYGLTEIKPKRKAHEEKVNSFEIGYAEGFPGKTALVEAQIPLATVQGLTREQLVKIPNIGEQTADAILSFLNVASAVPVTPEANGDAADAADAADIADDADDSANQNSTDGGAK